MRRGEADPEVAPGNKTPDGSQSLLCLHYRRTILTHYSSMRSQICAIDLFCGAGGLTYGLREAGVNVTCGVDIDPTAKAPYEHNNQGALFLHADVSQLTAESLEPFWQKDSRRLLVGCAPCQPFSTYSQARRATPDRRWGLLSEFGRLVTEANVDCVAMENVPALAKTGVFSQFVSTLRRKGFLVSQDIVDCSTLGLPQKRRRLVLIAHKGGRPIKTIQRLPAIKPPSVGKALAALSPLHAGETSSADSCHRVARLSKLNLARIRASKAGGSWRDWPKELKLPCHEKASGTGYMAVYGRLTQDGLAPTITTQCYNYGSGRFGHPTQDRALSLRESAILQGFPEAYDFDAHLPLLSIRDLARLIGNAVPPPLGQHVGNLITSVYDGLVACE